jgi:hypothetical protein
MFLGGAGNQDEIGGAISTETNAIHGHRSEDV